MNIDNFCTKCGHRWKTQDDKLAGGIQANIGCDKCSK